MKRQISATFLVALLVVSVMGPVVAFSGTVAASDHGPPSGMVGIPNENVDDLRASGIETNVTSGDFNGAVYVSKHAATTEVSLATRSQTDQIASGANRSDVAKERVCSNPAATKNPTVDCDSRTQLGLVISDAEHSEGRRVAIKTSVLENALGYVPESLTIKNRESGETWWTPASVEDGWLVADIPHFSTNTVSWSGTTNITGTYSDGTSTSYNLSNYESVSDPNVTFTGVVNTEWDNQSSTKFTGDSRLNADPAGNMDPTGPSVNDEPVFTISMPSEISDYSSDSAVNNGPDAGHIEDEDIEQIAFRDTSDNLLYYYPYFDNEKDTGEQAEHLAVGNTDNDNYDEIVFVDASTSDIKIYDNNGADVATTNSTPISSNEQLYVADFVGDAAEDIAFTNTTGTIYIYDVSGDSTTNTGESVQAGTITGADTDGDGTAELVFSDGSNNLKIHDVPDGTTTDTGQQESDRATVGDFDNDGSADIAYSDGSDNLDVYDISEDSVGSTGASTFSTHLESGDFDNDGVSEIAYKRTDALIAYADYEEDELHSPLEDTSVRIATGDFDNDGYDEIAYDDAKMYVYDPLPPAASFDIDVGDDGTVDTSLTVDTGKSDSVELPSMTPSDTYIGFSANHTQFDSDSEVTVSVDLEERTQTDSPSLELNGTWANHSSTLAAGETVSTSIDKSELQAGTNTINISMPSLSGDAPAMQVDVEYTHDSADEKEVSFDSWKWEEHYNVSNTYAGSREDPQLKVTFDRNVIGIASIEKQRNGGGWSSVGTSNYTLDGTTLTVDFASVSDGDTLSLRTNGSRVVTNNLQIETTDLTIVGHDPLYTEVNVTSRSATTEAWISVEGTPDGDRVHIVKDATWDVDEYSIHHSNGANNLYVNSVSAGDTFNVTTYPLTINPATGSVRIEIVNETNTTSPEFEVSPGESEGDAVDYTFTDAKDDQRYELLSKGGGVVRDSGTASSPLTLSDDDSDETLIFKADNDSADTEEGGGGGGGGGAPLTDGSADGISIPEGLVPTLGIGALGVLFFAAAYRFAGSRRDRTTATSGGGVASRVVSLPVRLFAGIGRVVRGAVGAFTYGSEAARPVTSRLRAAFVVFISSRLGKFLAIGVTAYFILTQGVLSLSDQVQLIVVVASTLTAVFFVLKRLGQFSFPLYSLITATVVVLSLSAMGSSFLSDVVQSPAFSIIAIIGGGIAWQLISAWRQGKTTNIIVRGDEQ